ncbi:protocadherin beta-16-like [Latimeria chalumnae]|uniref:protocadherin beta-16-like n=1 Tax=Latimeria chalumnae TaxID=7897 RepID=UPI00313D7E33
MAAPKSSTIPDPFTLNELNAALSATKSGKAAGPDGVYPEFLKALGPKVKRWLTFFFSEVLATICGQMRYWISEEMEKGSFVGNITNDLGLGVKELSIRRGRIVTQNIKQYFQVNVDTGALLIHHKIDREKLCGRFQPCMLYLEFMIENPLELHHTEVEIKDINDNSPIFPNNVLLIKILENASPGTIFLLESAHDLDVGTNSLQNYQLSQNEHFYLEIQTRSDGDKYPQLVIEKPLDREKKNEYNLTLIATDGGSPQRSGTAMIHIVILDINDNAPMFSQAVYKVSLLENASKGHLVVVLNATDLDEGSNSEITYSFTRVFDVVQRVFELNHSTGEIKVTGSVDYEEIKFYEIDVQATDGGSLFSHCKVLVEVIDVNDNVPKLLLTFVSSPFPENSSLGTVIALFSVKDADSGENGMITCFIQKDLPFVLKVTVKNYYELVTNKQLDREKAAKYDLTIIAIDSGFPPLSAQQSIQIELSDVNDNPPTFNQSSYTVFVKENNHPGSSIGSVQAFDVDYKENARIIYSVFEENIKDLSAPSFISINSDNGVIYALQSFNFEDIRDFHVSIEARDCGSPPLSSTVTVNVMILDENDNAPRILYPLQNYSSNADMVPRSSDTAHLVTKVIAVDVDSGQNAWLSYHLLKATDPTLFTVGHNTGEIRTLRPILTQDRIKQLLMILVKDNGQPSLSATVTLKIILIESFSSAHLELSHTHIENEYDNNITMYLIISLSVITFLFLSSVAILIFLRICQYRNSRQLFHTSDMDFCRAPTENFPPNYLDVKSNGTLTGTLSHNYSYQVCLATESVNKEFDFLNAYNSNCSTKNRNATQDCESGSSTIPDRTDEINKERITLTGAVIRGRDSERRCSPQRCGSNN